MGKVYVIPTVDTENMQSPLKEELYSECCVETVIDGAQWGLSRLLDIFNANAVRASFFLATEESERFGELHMQSIAGRIIEAGQDVEIHSHPLWSDNSMNLREHLWEYSAEEQKEIICRACEKVLQWTGEAPIAHRAGAYGINENTMEALAQCGISMDMSMFYGHSNCKYCKTRNGLQTYGSVLEVPVSGFYRKEKLKFGPVVVSAPTRFVKTDINSATLDEMLFMLRQAKNAGPRVITLFAHSYSLIEFDSKRKIFSPRPVIEEKLRGFLAECVLDTDVSVVSAKDFYRVFCETPELFLGNDVCPTYEKVVSGTDWIRRNYG